LKQKINHPTISSSDVIRPTLVEVNKKRIIDNYNNIRNFTAPAKIMPILKANAYGHGLVWIAKLMQELKADYIGVAVLEEGILLREAGIKMPILVLGGIIGNQVPHFLKNDLTITASSIEKLTQIEEASKDLKFKAKVHLKVDTGMERIGVHYYSADDFLMTAYNCKHIEVEGIYSHFANSTSADLTHARLQLERFNEVLHFYEKRSIQLPELIHFANSGAILQLPEAKFNMVRPGITLYGVYPSNEVKKTVKVKPSLSWKSRVVYFKVIQPGHPVSYGSTWETDHAVRAVTIPVGYGDGYLRSMSNKAEVIIRGKKYPVVGNITMDQVVANIEADSAYNGDEVILIGEMDGTSVTCEDLADWAGTIPYEVLTNINTRVPRIYID
jgi:alanine racemase